jgi:hypothetical protein
VGEGARANTQQPARNASVNREITLREEEFSDVSLATFHVFDNAARSDRFGRR